MHDDEKLTEKMKDGLEKTGDKMKEGFEKAKDFVQNTTENVKEKIKEGAEKLSEMKDNAVDAVQDTGENVNEQVTDGMDAPIGDTCEHDCLCHMYENMDECAENADDEENIIITERYEEYDEIIPNDNKDAA